MSSNIDVSLIPEKLADLEQWICWQEAERDGKATKVPIKPYHTNGTPNASATEAGHWRDLESALAFHESDRVRTDGIGFVFAPATPIVGVDLDDCRDPTTGELASWAQDIVDRLDSYSEVSPSGQGVHVIVEGELPPGRNRRGDVEMYDEARFFTVTTDHIEGTPTSLERRQDALLGVHYEYVQSPPDAETAPVDLEAAVEGAGRSDSSADERGQQAGEPAAGEAADETGASEPTTALGSDSGLYARYGLDYPDIEDPGLEAALHGLSPSALPSPLPTSMDDITGPGVDLDDETVLERAMDSKSGDVIEALYDGRSELWSGRDSRYPSQSEADMGLCFYLAFWTGGDPDRMDRLFRDSGLMRGKWDKVHFANGATYGEVCLSRTLLQVDDYYSPPDRPSGPADSAPIQSHSGDEPAVEPSSMTADATDVRAVEDAKRLASKVQHQQRELQAQRERIDALETRLQWYRQILGVQSKPDASDGDDHDVEGALGSTTDGSSESAPRETQWPPASVHFDSAFPVTHVELDQDTEVESAPTDASSGSDEESTQPSGFVNQLRRWFW
jgi:primase-polymerase (primpol)-like protein